MSTATKQDILNALYASYSVGGEMVSLPPDLRTKGENFLNSHDLTPEQCGEIMGYIWQAVAVAQEIGTTDRSKISKEDKQRLLNIAGSAASVADVEIKTDYAVSTITPVEKSTGKVLEEIKVKEEVFFKPTGRTWGEALMPWAFGFIAVIMAVISAILCKKVSDKKGLKRTIFCTSNVIVLVLIGLMTFSFVTEKPFEFLKDIEPFVTTEGIATTVNIKPTEIVEPIVASEIIYPTYGEQYGIIKIESINAELPIFYGDSLEILKNGVGHYTGSSLPNQGKTILYTAHNTEKYFKNLSKLKVGDKINISTNYGGFEYTVYDSKVVTETDKSKAMLDADEEILVIYTCYPFDSIGYTSQRYIVYCKRSV